jgi:hypothetical protein
MFNETDETDDLPGTLELHGGAIQISIYYTLSEEAGEEPIGYLRVAFGQGNAVNRILTSQGTTGQITTESGEVIPIRITSVDPSEAPGYLVAFTLLDGSESYARAA